MFVLAVGKPVFTSVEGWDANCLFLPLDFCLIGAVSTYSWNRCLFCSSDFFLFFRFLLSLLLPFFPDLARFFSISGSKGCADFKTTALIIAPEKYKDDIMKGDWHNL